MQGARMLEIHIYIYKEIHAVVVWKMGWSWWCGNHGKRAVEVIYIVYMI